MIEISTTGTSKDFDSLYAVNVRGTFLCYKYAGLQMVSQGRGGRLESLVAAFGRIGYNGYQVVHHAAGILQQNLLSVV
jgi:NAD(P)-dependent dehydrogenase (short-subunit alcohol dehydrogenase family)